MKMRYHAIGITVALLLIYGVTLYMVQNTTIEKGNFVEHNEIVKQIENELSERDSYTKSEECTVILINEPDYDFKLYQAYSDGMTVMDLTRNDIIIGKVLFPSSDKNILDYKRKIVIILSSVFLILLCGCYVLLFYLYRKLIKPFKTLKQFATNISQGDFEFSLHMNKDNYFGAFTESFDIMRDELLLAKQGEYEANLSKKELVASLSHDIKTPVSTIKANCELLRAMQSDAFLLKKLKIMENKADMIDVLISNMFHATMEELHMLKVNPKEELSTVILPMFEEVNHYNLIQYETEVPECLIYIDTLRLSQVIDNIISNSYKYANTKIHVSAVQKDRHLELRIQDEGKGVSEEELPILFQKFYRGKNAVSSNGSGLGLYLAKQFMSQMHGDICIENDNGFAVILTIPIV